MRRHQTVARKAVSGQRRRATKAKQATRLTYRPGATSNLETVTRI